MDAVVGQGGAAKQLRYYYKIHQDGDVFSQARSIAVETMRRH
jgi:hypothetical protein